MRFGLVAAFYSIYLFLALADSFAEYFTGGVTDEPAWAFFYYFTNQSNLFVLVWLSLFAYGRLRTKETWAGRVTLSRKIWTGAVLYMTVVFVIVQTILYPFYTGDFEVVPDGASLVTHVLSPFIVWAFYLLYPLQGRATNKTVLAWICYLWAYVAVVNVVGATQTWKGGKPAYCYDFLNPGGYPNIWVYLLVIAALSVAVYLVGLGVVRAKTLFDWGSAEAVEVESPTREAKR
jgi:hypothetical protein